MTVFVPFAEGLAALSALLFWLGCFLLLVSYRATLGAVLTALGNLLGSLNIGTPFGTIPLGSALAGPLVALNSTIEAGLATAVSASDRSWHFWMHALASSLTWIGEAVAWDMHEVAKAFAVLRHSTIPGLIATAINAALHPVSFALSELVSHRATEERVLKHAVAAATSAATTAKHAADVAAPKIEPIAKAAAAAAIAVPIPRIGAIERDVSGIKSWIREHEHLLTKAGVVGLVAAALSELGLGNSNCSNNKKLSKGICGLAGKVLDDLLAGLIAIVGSISIVTVAIDYQALLSDLTGEIRTFWRTSAASSDGGDPGLGESNFSGKSKVSNSGPNNPGLGATGF